MIANTSFESFQAKPIEDIYSLCREGAKLGKRISDATSEYDQSAPAMGKVLCVLGGVLAEGKGKAFPRTMELPGLWKQITGEKSIKPRFYSCSVAFDIYVGNKFLEEKVYDGSTVSSLELAASVYSTVGDVTHEAVRKSADVLNSPSKDSAKAKELRAILDSVKPARELDAEKALEMLKSIFADLPHGLEFVLIHAGAQVAYVKDEAVLKECFAHLGLAVQQCGTEEQQDAWMAEKQPAAVTTAAAAHAAA